MIQKECYNLTRTNPVQIAIPFYSPNYRPHSPYGGPTLPPQSTHCNGSCSAIENHLYRDGNCSVDGKT